MYAVGGDILSLDNNTIFKLRRICHAHFEPRYHTRSLRLSANAVPTLNLPGNHHYFQGYRQHNSLSQLSTSILYPFTVIWLVIYFYHKRPSKWVIHVM